MPKSRTRKKAHQKLERLNQSWLNTRHDKTIVAREIQLLILWKQNLWNYHMWKNITDFMDEQGTPPSQAPHTASNRAHAPFNEVLAGPRQSAHPATVAQSTVLGPRMPDPMS